MTKRTAVCTVALLATAMLLALVPLSDAAESAKKYRKPTLPGTWFIALPNGLTGFYTYHHGGTMTGSVSNIHGAPPQASDPLFTTASADHGIWRRVRGGFEGVVFRMTFEPIEGHPVSILRLRTRFAFEPGGDSAPGTYGVDVWFCPDALSCPDPSATPPDLADVGPPAPFNGFSQTRIGMP